MRLQRLVKSVPGIFIVFITVVNISWIQTVSAAQPPRQSPKKLSKIILPQVQFNEAELDAVFYYLSQKAKELGGRPTNFALFDPSGKVSARDPKVTFSLQRIPLSEVVKYVAQLSNLSYAIDNNVVWFGDVKDLQTMRARRKSLTGTRLASSPLFARLGQIKIPEVDFSDTTLEDAVEGLRQLERINGGTGNYVVIPGKKVLPSQSKVSMALENVSLGDLVLFCSEQSNFRLRVDGNTVVFRGADARPPASAPLSRNSISNHLSNVRIKELSVSDITIPEMIEVLRHHSKTGAFANGGINIVNMVSKENQKTVSLDLKNVSLFQVLLYLNEQTDTAFRSSNTILKLYDRPAEKPTAPTPAAAATPQNVF